MMCTGEHDMQQSFFGVLLRMLCIHFIIVITTDFCHTIVW